MDPVYIIETPSPTDLYEGRCEGRALTEALRLAGTEVHHRLAVDQATFADALASVAEHFVARRRPPDSMPFIHISAHGDTDGVSLTDGDDYFWGHFRRSLDEINQRIGFAEVGLRGSPNIARTVLGFSTCEGFIAKAIHETDPCPFQCLVGPTSKVDWADALTAFQVFYHLANTRAGDFSSAVTAMNLAAALQDEFQLYLSPELGWRAPTA